MQQNQIHFYQSLIEQHSRMKPFALKLTGDTEEANDLIQESFMKAVMNQDKFREGTNMGAWLYTILRNTFISRYHKQKRQRQVFSQPYDPQLSELPKFATENTAGDEIAIQEIRHVLSTLQDNLRTPLILYAQGYKYHEIVDQLNVPMGTVKNRIHLARKELQDRLQYINAIPAEA